MEYLIGNAFDPNSKFTDDGGEVCANQMTNTYRIAVSVISSLLHIYLITSVTLPYINKRIKPLHDSPSILEKFLGLCSIGIIIAQFYYKSLLKKLIFIFQPCHIITMLQIKLLFSKPSKVNHYIFIACMAWNFGAVLAMIFPTRGEVVYEGENFLFWFQHALAAIISPIVLSYRYFRPFKLSIYSISSVKYI